MKNMIIASSSTVYGSNYLDYLIESIKTLYKGVGNIVFIPYARPGGKSHDLYTKSVKYVLSQININVKGIHEFDNPVEAIKNAEGIFTGGGNSFVLVNQLYRNNLMEIIKDAVNKGTPYLGCSSGSNICGLTMSTTNDMPIVYPPSFKTMGLLPFNINPHYLDPDTSSKHMGETREIRIKEFHKFNTQPVVGLREGSWLEVKGETIILKGKFDARIFEQSKPPYEFKPESDLSHLN